MDLVNLGVNVIAFEKNNHKYGMTCAWLTMVGYDEIVMLIGSQSDTGHHIEINDIIGISSLANNQEEIALNFGDHHSSIDDKFINKNYYLDDGAILIEGAKGQMKCQVFDIKRVKGNNEDFLIFVKVLKSKIDENKKFLSRENMVD